MSRKITSAQQAILDQEADKKAKLQLIEARRKLNAASRRSPSVTSVDGGIGTKGTIYSKKDLAAHQEKPELRSRKLSGASSASNRSNFRWVNLDGKGNWQRVEVEVITTDDFKDEDQAGTKSGEESDQYWDELNRNIEKREEFLRKISTDYIDIPDISLANEEVLLEHKEEISTCQVTQLEKHETVNQIIHKHISELVTVP